MFKKFEIKEDRWIVETPEAMLYVGNFYNKHLSAWEAIQRNDGSYTDGMGIHSTDNVEDFDGFIEECRKVVNICPKCGKYVPLKEQKRVAFANRCCSDCYPALKAKLEYPGWYN